MTGPGEWLWRYRVVGIEGDVPPAVAELLDEPDGFLLYYEPDDVAERLADEGAW